MQVCHHRGCCLAPRPDDQLGGFVAQVLRKETHSMPPLGCDAHRHPVSQRASVEGEGPVWDLIVDHAFQAYKRKRATSQGVEAEGNIVGRHSTNHNQSVYDHEYAHGLYTISGPVLPEAGMRVEQIIQHGVNSALATSSGSSDHV